MKQRWDTAVLFGLVFVILSAFAWKVYAQSTSPTSITSNQIRSLPVLGKRHVAQVLLATPVTSYVVPGLPTDLASDELAVYRNGLLQAATIDYTFAAATSTVTFLPASATAAEDILQFVWFR